MKNPDKPNEKAKTPPSHLDLSVGKMTEDDRKMCGLMMRIRRVDHFKTDTNGINTVNLVKGAPLQVTGPGLPTYSALFPHLLMTHIKALSPEGLAILPSTAEDVKNIMQKTTVM